jgi:hypothetical protein
LLEPGEFWRRIDRLDSGVLLVAFLQSWKRIGDSIGVEGVDLAGHTFDSLCRLAYRRADHQARLSMTVYAAYWSTAGEERLAIDVLGRWLPMTIASKRLSMEIVAPWAVLERRPGETAHDLFRRVQAELDARVQALPPEERHRPFHNGSDLPAAP